MTLRETIADWISGGALEEAKWQAGFWKESYNTTSELLHVRTKGIVGTRAALRAIIERGTTASPNSTVRAMVKIAKEALGE